MVFNVPSASSNQAAMFAPHLARSRLKLSLWVPETHPRRSDTISRGATDVACRGRETRRRARRSSSRAVVDTEHGEDGLAEVNLRLRDLASPSPSPAVVGSRSAAAAPETTAVESRVESRGASTCATVGDSEALPRHCCSRLWFADQEKRVPNDARGWGLDHHERGNNRTRREPWPGHRPGCLPGFRPVFVRWDCLRA